MTRHQVLRRQIAVVAAVALVALIVLGVRSFLLSFAHQVPLGRLTEAMLISAGPVAIWHDQATLDQIRAALPGYRPGPGYKGYKHGHQSMGLVLKDDQGREVALGLPTDESPLVTIRPSPRIPAGNSWNMPELLGLLGRLGMEALETKKLDDALAEYQFRYWRDTFGKGKTSAV